MVPFSWQQSVHHISTGFLVLYFFIAYFLLWVTHSFMSLEDLKQVTVGNIFNNNLILWGNREKTFTAFLEAVSMTTWFLSLKHFTHCWNKWRDAMKGELLPPYIFLQFWFLYISTKSFFWLMKKGSWTYFLLPLAPVPHRMLAVEEREVYSQGET